MSAWVSVAGAGVIWLALLGPVIALATNLSGSAIASSLTAPGALDPLVTSVESGLVTLGVLFVVCTPLAWMLARGKLPFPRVWETGVLCSLLLPPLAARSRGTSRAPLGRAARPGSDGSATAHRGSVRSGRLRPSWARP